MPHCQGHELLKILQISYVFPPELSIGDGITNVVYNLSKELVRQGHDVSVYASNALDLTGQKKIKSSKPRSVNGVRVHYLDYLIKYQTFFYTPRLVSLLNRTISSFDVVHIHDLRSFQGIATAFFAEKHGVPYVYHPHGSFLSSLPQSFVTRTSRILLDRIASTTRVRNAAKIIASNQDESDLFTSCLKIPKQKLTILPNGLDLDIFKIQPAKGHFRKSIGLKKTDRMILYLGRIHHTKGISLILRAFSHLKQYFDFECAKLVLVGPDGGYLGEAHELADSLGIIDSVKFAGFVSNEERHQALVDSDIFLTPSFTGFPITFLEACANGLPIVTTTLGEQLDWIDGNAGVVATPTPQNLASSMYKLLSNERLRIEMSQRCIEIVKSTFSLEAVVRKLVRIYKDVVNSGTQHDTK
jgi:glycosyltransferase involved in cell wall biosynthesis